ncbi:MAG: FmdB family zinc ribbon protein [Methylococcaceae bacterium]
MPIYEYDCSRCGDFTALRPMAEFRAAQPCPSCGVLAPRVLLNAPGLPVLSTEMRRSHALNERSAHEPRHSSAAERASSGHGSGCACCKPGAKSARVQQGVTGAKSFPGQRPWMISH